MTKPKKKANQGNSNALTVSRDENESEEVAMAKTALRPTLQSAATIMQYNRLAGELDLGGLMTELAAQTKTGIAGDMGRGEAMLIAQAHTLDAMFNDLARRAIKSEYLSQAESYLKMSLRAQSQCRSTWEAVSAIKNPPIAYVKQANIAQIQQINNAAPCMEEKEIPQNELLEQAHYERLDTGTQGETITDDPAMATVGEVNGAKKP
jgi:hypothetical protein